MKDIFLKLFNNPVVAGSVAVLISGTVMYTFKSLPVKFWHFLLRRVTITLAVTGEDKAFDTINVWLAQQDFTKRSRNLKFFSIGSTVARLAPGFGNHVFWTGGILPTFINRRQDDKVSGGSWTLRPKETIYITVFGRSHKKILEIIERVEQQKREETKDQIRIFVTGSYGSWSEIEARNKRPVNNLFIPSRLITEIFDYAKWFSDNRQWYIDRGIPYRLGYLFYGPPGTGKTSTAITLASDLNRPLYILNPFSIGSEDYFNQAFSRVPKDSIVLIEDADSLEASPVSKNKKDKEERPRSPVSMSAVLNAIDGATSIEGRILIMTTNHVTKLRPALIRPGRIDKKIEIGLMKPEEVKRMATAFFPNSPDLVSKAFKEASSTPPKAGAVWQQKFITTEEDLL